MYSHYKQAHGVNIGLILGHRLTRLPDGVTHLAQSQIYRVHLRERFNSMLFYPLKLIYFNFQPLEVVSRYRDPQPQVYENY